MHVNTADYIAISILAVINNDIITGCSLEGCFGYDTVGRSKNWSSNLNTKVCSVMRSYFACNRMTAMRVEVTGNADWSGDRVTVEFCAHSGMCALIVVV